MFRKLTSSPLLPLAPALIVVLILLGASLFYAVAQSFGFVGVTGENQISLDAYRTAFNSASEFWVSLGFTLWISIASTLLASVLAVIVAVWLAGNCSSGDMLALNWNLAFPHLVWAIALLLFLSQSGLLARWAATVGLIHTPGEFPILVQDRYGIGILLHYISKEIPFLALIILAVLQSQPFGYDVVAENLGANRWQRLRYVTLPQIMPALLAGALLVFGFVFSSYEVPALLGINYPRALPVLALHFFLEPDLHARSEGMVISLVITFIVLLVALVSLRWEGRKE